MTVLISEDPKKGTTTIRHTWRAEIFAEYGQDTEIRAHRAETVYDTDTEDLVRTTKDRVVLRNLDGLPDGQRQTVLAFFALLDILETEDLQKEQESANKD